MLIRNISLVLLVLPVFCFTENVTVFATEKSLHVSPKAIPQIPTERQFTTISKAIENVESGGTIEIHSGIYRESIVVPKEKSGTAEQPLRLVAAANANVVISGCDVISDWKPETKLASSVVSTAWNYWFEGPHPNDKQHQLVGRCEQVFVNRYPLRQVLNIEQLAPGTFFVDLEQKRIYLWDVTDFDATKNDISRDLYIEAATRNRVLLVDADYVHLSGIRFQNAANLAQRGMTQFRGNNALIEDCVFEQSNSSGATFLGTGITVRRCEFIDNGQLGFSASHAHGLRLESCLIARNNTKNFSRGWESGGNKLVLCRDVVIDQCITRDNRGVGFWFDIGNENCEVKNCLILHNEDHGLFYEIGYTLNAHDNVIIGNGHTRAHPSWGKGAGIMISDSIGCRVQRNLVVANGGDGLMYREQRRTTPRLDSPETSPDKDPTHWLRAGDANGRDAEYWIWNSEHLICNNIFAYNGQSQVRGWFDVADARHWTRSLQKEMGGREVLRNDDITSPYVAKEGEEPIGRSLETLKLRHENNFFARTDQQKLFVWGVPWKKFREYDELTKVSSELLGLENGSKEGNISFADFHAFDLRIPADTNSSILQCYPQGNVPNVKLGTE